MEWKDKVVLVIGGTGSFGSNFIPVLLKKNPHSVRVYSRDEHKQSELIRAYGSNSCISGFIGDIRDFRRLSRAMEGVDIVIHCAALKQVQSCEYNPLEAIKTNIIGSMNIIDAALDNNVDRVLAISTDKAASPLNLYGATKMCMERLFTAANSYRGKNRNTKFCCTRYGNVVASRGTIVPMWRTMLFEKKIIPITNPNATRFWIGMAEANQFVMECVEMMDKLGGGEVIVPRIPSVNVMDVYTALTDGLTQFSIIGDRVGDKLHETLVTKEEAKHTFIVDDKFVILPEDPKYAYIPPKGAVFEYQEGYRSDNNKETLSIDQIKVTLEKN